jgi:ferredoxin
MSLKKLKYIRIAVSLFIFSFLLLFFLNIHNGWLDSISTLLLRLQLFPSLIRFFAIAFSVSSMGFLAVIIFTLLFGRVYCSSLCPLGTLQDIINNLMRRFRKKSKRRFVYNPSKKRFLRYSVLTATILFWIMGSLFLVNLLDPFSNFGKISVTLFQPIFSRLNNSLSFFLQSRDIYSISPMLAQSLPIDAVAVSLGIFATLFTMSAFRGRFFCNTLCPAGSMLGLVSSRSVFQIRFREESCTMCRKCEFACKAECIDSINKTVDSSRCVSCFNCFTVCKHEGLYFENTLSKAKKATSIPLENLQVENLQTGKRNFLLTLAAGALSIPVLNKVSIAVNDETPGFVPTGTKTPITPPGSLGNEHFNDNCIACYLCVGACPTNVIVPSFFDYGLKGFMQPKLDYHKSFCNYDCIRCSEVCPTGAITKIDKETKHVAQVGIAKFIEESCIVTIEGTDCGACSEHCPTKAVQMVPFSGNLRIPEVTDELCIGCGACEFACPTEPFKAIYVESNVEHKTAQALGEDEGPRESEEEEFPF